MYAKTNKINSPRFHDDLKDNSVTLFYIVNAIYLIFLFPFLSMY